MNLKDELSRMKSWIVRDSEGARIYAWNGGTGQEERINLYDQVSFGTVITYSSYQGYLQKEDSIIEVTFYLQTNLKECDEHCKEVIRRAEAKMNSESKRAMVSETNSPLFLGWTAMEN